MERRLNQPIVNMARRRPRLLTWWLPTAGCSPSAGRPSSAPPVGLHLNQPIEGIALTADSIGYRMVASDGGIFSFGIAPLLRLRGRTASQPAHRGDGIEGVSGPGRHGAAARRTLRPLDIAYGIPMGMDPVGTARAAVAGASRRAAAIDAVLTEALQRTPCLLSFSGGRDSSALLAAAVAVARREGLDLPVPATLVFPQSEDSNEDEWQALVLRHLGRHRVGALRDPRRVRRRRTGGRSGAPAPRAAVAVQHPLPRADHRAGGRRFGGHRIRR